MRTVTRALALLDMFTESRPRLRLADAVRLSGIEKATCHRMLRALQAAGYVDQSDEDRRYSLGPAVLRLARMREAVTPTAALLRPVVERLTAETGETSHASLLAGGKVLTVASCDGLHANRVHVEAGGLLAQGATASGLACLAWGPMRPADAAEAALAQEARLRGYSRAEGTYDPEVLGIGAPIFGAAGVAVGAVAVASPLSRRTPGFEARVADAAIRAGCEATRLFAGRMPADFVTSLQRMQA